MPELDVIVVGGGIAGLYAAYNLLKKNPDTRLVLLEKDKELGGRAKMAKFCGTEVVQGAGIGRVAKDKLLMKLAAELGVEIHKFPIRHHYSPALGPVPNIMETFKALKAQRARAVGQSFRAFASEVLGGKAYRAFVAATGYSDFERDGAINVLDNYGMEDNVGGWEGFRVSWSALVKALVDRIGADKIRTGISVASVSQNKKTGDHSEWTAAAARGMQWTAPRVVLALDAPGLQKVLPAYMKSQYKSIRGQPFARVYAKVANKTGRAAMAEATQGAITVVPAPLQEIIPMSSDVYMVAYADNASAKRSMELAKDKEALAREIERALAIDQGVLKLSAVKAFYWEAGTHFLKPVYPTASGFRGYDGLKIVGEAVAQRKGWVEGALETA